MSDLTTSYLGLTLKNPLVCSSSPLCERVDNIRRMEDAGASAVVLHSLFEEQITVQSQDLDRMLSHGTESFAEALDYFPDMTDYNLGPDGYLEHIRQVRAAVDIPVIASLNGSTLGGWIQYARLMEEAGASALELNVYRIPTDPTLSSASVEQDLVNLVREVRGSIGIPVAVKLGPFFTALVALAAQLEQAGAGALVLFNRFYQPDFDLDTLEVVPRLHLSTADELLLRLHWVAILCGHFQGDLAITGGVHSAQDVVKSMMAGASVAMMTSALLLHGIRYLARVHENLAHWLEEHEYESIQQMQGSMSLASVSDPSAYERANYMKVLRSYALRERD